MLGGSSACSNGTGIISGGNLQIRSFIASFVHLQDSNLYFFNVPSFSKLSAFSSLTVNRPLIDRLNENQQGSMRCLTLGKYQQQKKRSCNIFFRPPGSALIGWAVPFGLRHHPKDWAVSTAPGKNKVSPAQVGAFDLHREERHLIPGSHLKPKLHFSPALTFSSFPPLHVSDAGLTKVLIRNLPPPHCGLLLRLASGGLLIMSHIMSAYCHSKSLHFSLFHSSTGHIFFDCFMSREHIWHRGA